MSSISKKNINENHYGDMMLALLPLILCATVMYSRRVLLLCAAAFVTARIVDVGMAVVRGQEIDSTDRSSTVAAITFCMMLPVSVPLYVVIISVALTTLVGKHVFGGKDVYPFNLTALEMCVAAVNWPTETFKAIKPFAQVNFWTGAATGAASSSLQIKTGGLPYISTLDLLLGNHAGAMGSSFIIIILAVAFFLIISKRITWHLPVSFLVTCSVIAVAFPRIYGISRVDSLKYELLTSALIFCAVFMLNEPATTPKKSNAKVIFGVVCGVLTMLFRYYGSYEIGACFAILLANATEGYWDRLFIGKAEKQRNKNKRKKPAEKPVKPQPQQTAEEKEDMSVSGALNIISRAEDDIDQVEFSTQTIDVSQALKDLDRLYNREDK